MGDGGRTITFTVNGRRLAIAPPPPQTTLLDSLRAHGLTSVKEGCAEGECGACMVALVANGPNGTEYRAVNSCLMFAPMADGCEILTAEGLVSDGQLSEAQRAIAQAGGSQCGYCTPGFVVSLFAEQYRPGRTAACDPLALAGNLCRCTGYRPIADAARALGPAPDDRFRQRLLTPAPRVDRVSVDGFSRPATIDECVALLAQHPGATMIAGGTDLGVESNLKRRRWPHLVSLDGIDELREFQETPTSIQIGAAVRLTDVGRLWRGHPPAIAEWLELFASPAIRNRATLGGNLATASPIGDAAPLLLALDASVHVAGATGRRIIPLEHFFTGYRTTALRPGELLTRIDIPKPLPSALRFYKISKRRLDDISTIAAAFAYDRDNAARVRRARMAFGGAAATPIRVAEVERDLVSRPFDEQAVVRVQQIIGRTLSPLSDHRGSREYRLAVAQSLVEKFWWDSRS